MESGVIERRGWSHMLANGRREGVQHCRKERDTWDALGRSVVERALSRGSRENTRGFMLLEVNNSLET
ncbi:hypothetical protein L484_017646 [Morus notabilis]|uniref:Uncharacterized protein n=1 Tax=Morus notabilis TaxID=981085 RepID=W9S8J3_9ROSA|nr:hypothetical protein L484_017646 [Morus notabilis]